jgi:hypothetical protein
MHRRHSLATPTGAASATAATPAEGARCGAGPAAGAAGRAAGPAVRCRPSPGAGPPGQQAGHGPGHAAEDGVAGMLAAVTLTMLAGVGALAIDLSHL